jgi:hypothetical protein
MQNRVHWLLKAAAVLCAPAKCRSVTHVTLETRLTLAALDAALQSRRPAEGLIHHSDRGSQYAAKPYRERLDLHGIRGSTRARDLGTGKQGTSHDANERSPIHH